MKIHGIDFTSRPRRSKPHTMDTLRASAIDTGGADALSARDRQQLACRLDRFLAQAR